MSIVEFYTGQEIFLTGGTGFVGKAIIEKILRSLPNIGKLFVLIRNKKGKSADERLKEILQTSLFRRVREEQPQAFSKVYAISGDCKELGLGISLEDLEKIRNVTMIFHSAACVRFDDHLKDAILLNTRGTHELVKIAETLPKLKSFVHVSTTYAYPEIHKVEEKVYPPYADWRTTIKLAETYDLETLDIFFSKYSQDQPNTYTFTKSLSEHIINEYRHKIPMAIFRPSIVISTVEEPFPGWIDNFNGPIGMLVACGVGILRTNNSNPDIVSDFIPVDICVKSLLVAAYKLASGKNTGDIDNGELPIYNCSNSSMNYLSNGDLIALGKKIILNNPMEKCIWLPEGSITRCAVWHYIRFIFLQIIPAIILDLMLRLAKVPPILMKLQRRIYTTDLSLHTFFNNEWTFINDNLKDLEKLIPENEQSLFSFFIYANYDQSVFFTNGLRGAKEFLFKENPDASPQARFRMHIFRILHYTFQFIGIYYIVQYLLRTIYLYITSA